MAEIVNLRMARKQKARAGREKIAVENRALHGRAKAERLAGQKLAEHAEAMLEGHLRERPADAAGKSD